MPRSVVNGAGLEYLLEGGGKETVALLNGIAMSIAHWKPIADKLVTAGFSVLMHDMRGQLLSEKPAERYSLEGHARDLAALISELGIRKVHVIGTSYGAEVGLTFARDFPEQCASLTSIDGATEYDSVLGAAVLSWKAAALSDPRLFYKTLQPWNYSASWLAANGESIAIREDMIASLPRDYFEAFGRLCDAFMDIHLTSDLGRVRCPCLVLVAEHDILKHKGYSDIIAHGIQGARYEELPGAGHAIVIEKPELVTDSFLRFFDTLR